MRSLRNSAFSDVDWASTHVKKTRHDRQWGRTWLCRCGAAPAGTGRPRRVHVGCSALPSLVSYSTARWRKRLDALSAGHTWSEGVEGAGYTPFRGRVEVGSLMTANIKTRMRITLDLYFLHSFDWPVACMASKECGGAACIAAASYGRARSYGRVTDRCGFVCGVRRPGGSTQNHEVTRQMSVSSLYGSHICLVAVHYCAL
jgi:hypothetical protein